MRSRPLVTTGALAATVSVLIVLLYAGLIGRRLGDPGVLALVGVLLVVAALAVLTWSGVVAARVRGQVRRVEHLRPGVPLVVGRPTAALTAEARSLRAGTRGLPPDTSDREHVVYAFLPDRVELWVRGDDAPRWWVTLPAPVATGTVRVGRTTLDALSLRDAAAHLQLVPTSADARAWTSRAHRAAAVERTHALLDR
ncbi:hypothetical protein [Isoptericola dokdonensis]|uniref:Uncharacterized protein n=1 Tax=Isoptericola dokdonensis DS-3 TaxID=1300344 RepID=A0A161HSS9_9MICO|nr:hypothetical protein [Isoptericola dokdonensis]ANC32642.1 hypothetical protein I598_3127 [Isoptericola dokdonensis DS-3]